MDPAWVSHVTNELSQMRQEIVALRNEVNALNNDASTDLRREVNAIWDQFRLSFDSIIAIRNEMLLKFALVDNYHAIHYNNKLIFSGDRNLAHLRSIVNFKPIPGFPATVDDIGRLTANAVDTILDHLDGKRDGLLFERKERLRSIIGLVKNAPELTSQHE
ncbi:Peptide-N4-(N-acetyl-beta-glucosaminyl)asparagine amidase A [Lasiodiplodia theobromae]|uniref:Peptide-N4-(N-acetyl-beta- glucosaminyl)asparagine amidase A n=1 Tax=Lasiodiplodia theobromae TaxID=45133 RepID=UPI0015C34CD5|nr:Peptide-N4-(N-acetyl-beta-glucosaminyl)asparagine amidase A [Lasiodiplodia theobromae]KAF4544084.1 Peptide-N4-(N-acetyl-beta-glucosaminyl)asparagine amidase A [Lasiodiplodia theobromae]